MRFILFGLFLSVVVLSALVSAHDSSKISARQQILNLVSKNTNLSLQDPKLLLVDSFIDHIINFIVQGFVNTVEELELEILCEPCRAVFDGILDIPTTDFYDIISDIAVEVCIKEKIAATLPVCQGAVGEMVPVILGSFGDHYLNSNFTCPWLGVCPEVYFPLSLEEFINQTIADKPNKTYPVPTKRATFKVVHLTDLHFDLYYEANTSISCDVPVCCRNESGAPNGTSDASLYWGSIGNCDLPLRTAEQFALWTVNNINPDFVIWTGDNVAHDIWNQSKEYNINYTLIATQLLQDYFSVPVYPIVGNHECFPVNEWQYGTNREDDITTAFGAAWAQWIGNDSAAFYAQYGYFSSFNEQFNVRIIAINTQACNNLNWFLFTNPTDPGGMLAWLNETLAASEQNDEAVFIIGHIPPSGGCVYEWSARYKAVTDRYSYNIRGQFFGHSHSDFYHLVKSYSTNETVSIMFETPSLTTYSWYSPGIRVFEFDLDTSIPINYYQYRLDLEKWNSNTTGPIEWDLCYDFLSEYDLPDMSFASYDNLTQRILTDPTTYNKLSQNQVGCYSNISVALADTPQNDLSVGQQILTTQQDMYCSTTSVDMDYLACMNETNFSNSGNFEDWVQAVIEGPWVSTGNKTQASN